MTMETKMRATGFVIEPLDVLFFRGGRPIDPPTRNRSDLPNPQVLSGAMRTSLLAESGIDFPALARALRNGRSHHEALFELGAPTWIVEARFRGPFLAIEADNGDIEPLLPAPATLARDEDTGRIVRSDPLKGRLPGWKSLRSGMVPLWRRDLGDCKPLRGFVTLAGISTFLSGSVPDESQLLEPNDLFEIDERTGIAIGHDSQTAEEGMIYSAGYLSLKKRLRSGGRPILYSEVLTTPSVTPGFPEPWVFPFGGQSRYVHTLQVEPVRWPNSDAGKDGDGTLLMMATPGFYRNGWMPDAISEKDIICAAVSEPIPLSGWDVARGGPRPNRFAAPAGSVYFLCENWNHDPPSLCEDSETAAQGFGFYLKGEWHYV